MKDNEVIFEPQIKLTKRGGHGKNLLSAEEARKRYSNDKVWLLATEWIGVKENYGFMCLLHDTFFVDNVQSAIRRNTPKCNRCRMLRNTSNLRTYASKIPQEFFLLANQWRGVDSHYLFFCQKHEEVYVFKYSDIVYRKSKLTCCWTESFYGKKKEYNYLDIISKYMVYKYKENDKDG